MFSIQAGELKDVRPSWDEFFMERAESIVQRSTCIRMQTGAVLVKDCRVISEGYNGTVPGDTHCMQHWFDEFMKSERRPAADASDSEILSAFQQFTASSEFAEAHHAWSTIHEIHGEQNCILFAARQGIATNQHTTMYTVYSPCIYCAKVIVTAGISRVVYRTVYNRDVRLDGIRFLEQHGVSVLQLRPVASK